MSTSQKRAIQSYRARLTERGLARFEVLARDGDRDLIRSLARRLAEDGPDASRLRAVVNQSIAGDAPRKGGIVAALRRSPLVGVNLDVARPREHGAKSGSDALSDGHQHHQQHHEGETFADFVDMVSVSKMFDGRFEVFDQIG